MALPDNPVSGGHTLTNPGFDDHWTCPNCYADFSGSQHEDTIVECACGAHLRCTVESQPVCRTTCVDPDIAGAS